MLSDMEVAVRSEEETNSYEGHIPGPYILSYKKGKHYIRNAHGEMICCLKLSQSNEKIRARQLATANLLLAAPELARKLKVCEEFREWMKRKKDKTCAEK